MTIDLWTWLLLHSDANAIESASRESYNEGLYVVANLLGLAFDIVYSRTNLTLIYDTNLARRLRTYQANYVTDFPRIAIACGEAADVLERLNSEIG